METERFCSHGSATCLIDLVFNNSGFSISIFDFLWRL